MYYDVKKTFVENRPINIYLPSIKDQGNRKNDSSMIVMRASWT